MMVKVCFSVDRINQLGITFDVKTTVQYQLQMNPRTVCVSNIYLLKWKPFAYYFQYLINLMLLFYMYRLVVVYHLACILHIMQSFV